MKSGGMLHADVTSAIIEASIAVSNELGSGFVESVYEKALLIVLRENGHKVSAQVPLEVGFRGQCVGQFVADVVVDDKVIVELKAAKALTPVHQAQVINYLNATGYDVGLLVNFGSPKVEWKRLHRKTLSKENQGSDRQGTAAGGAVRKHPVDPVHPC